MLEQDEPIDRVMRMSGYRNRSTFYRAFQAETGLTPREFITSK
jgi:AraC-like DNA-binding protein